MYTLKRGRVQRRIKQEQPFAEYKYTSNNFERNNSNCYVVEKLEMASLSNSKWQNRKVRPNQSTNSGHLSNYKEI